MNSCKNLFVGTLHTRYKVKFVNLVSHIFNKSQPVVLRVYCLNPFSAKGFPIDEKNRLALDRVKSVSTSLALKGLIHVLRDISGHI